MRIIGIDPGTRNVGYGIIEEQGSGLCYIASGTVVTRGTELAQRLVEIYNGLKGVIQLYQPDEAGVETVYAGANIQTAIAIGEGRGVALLAAAESGIAVCGYEPSLIKKAVAASGRAGKEQVQEMVRILLALKSLPETDHEADALAIAITHSRRRGVESMVGMSGSRRNSRGRKLRKR